MPSKYFIADLHRVAACTGRDHSQFKAMAPKPKSADSTAARLNAKAFK